MKVKRSFLTGAFIAVILLIGNACSRDGAGTPTPDIGITKYPGNASVTNTPEPQIAASPTDIPGSPAPEPINPPTQTVAIMPQTPLSGEGPWLLIPADNGLWIANQDGSGLTHLTEENDINLRKSLSPNGDLLAFVAPIVPDETTWPELFIMQLPSGDLTHVASLFAPTDTLSWEIGDPSYEATRAIAMSAPVWSPDGRQLAFMGAQDGPTSDLYVYSLDDGRIDRLTDGPSQGYKPSWSPDGKWIVHTGAESFGTGAGYNMNGIWAASADRMDVRTLYPIDENGGDEVIVGWNANDTIIVHSWNMQCESQNLRAVNVETSEVSTLWGNWFIYGVSFDPVSKSMLVAMRDDAAWCEDSGYAAGTYLIREDRDREPERVADLGFHRYDPQANLFFIITQEDRTLTAVTPDGEIVFTPSGLPGMPASAPGGDVWAWAGRDSKYGPLGVWVGSPQEEAHQILEERATSPAWSPDGNTLFFVSEDEDTLYAAFAPEFTPIMVSDHLKGIGSLVWTGQ
jgi:dipeptidyl aminopeptidase/acylaminoacyl peptidase